jgi:hypothetical protein
MGNVLYFGGALLYLASFIWLLVIVFQSAHWGHGVVMILIPCYAWIYAVMHFDECSSPFWGLVLGCCVTFGGQQMMVGGG